jgi:HK97 family phage major capsid protein
MAEQSLDQKIQSIRDAIYDTLRPKPLLAPAEQSDPYYWIQYVYDGYVILSCDDAHYRLDYTVDKDGVVTAAGEMQPVEMNWTPTKGILYAGNVEDDRIAAKSGARHSASDQGHIQAVHDHAVSAGATCSTGKAVNAVKGNELKAISATDDELRVGNHIILFGGRDLTGVVHGKNIDGSSGEFFTEKTDCESSYTKTGILHVDFEHGQDPDNLGISDDDVLGYVDWKTAKKDEQGIFVERVLNRRSQYVQWLEKLIDEGLVGNSTQAVLGKTQKTKGGEITKWPLYRDTLTVTPMEPRMISENAAVAIKGLSEQFPAFKSLFTAPVAAKAAEPINPTPNSEETMTEEEMKALLEKVSAEAATKAVEEFKKAQPATVKAGTAVVRDPNDKPFKSIGEQLMDIKQYKKGGGFTPRLTALEAELKANGMSEFINADGGFALQPDFTAALLSKVYNPPGAGTIIADVTTQPVSGNGFRALVVDETSRVSSRRGGFIGYWIGEGGTITPTKPALRRAGADLEKVVAMTYLTDELAADAPALSSFVEREGSNELRFQLEDKVINGTGAGVPQGLLNAKALITVAKEAGQGAGTVMTENVTKMWARMPAYLMNSAKWYINQELLPQLVTLSIAVGVGGQIVPAAIYTMPSPQYPFGQLFGRPVVPVEYCAALGTVGDIILAAMGEYFVINNGGIQTASSIHVAFTTDETALRLTWRVNGFPWWADAMTPYKGANTLSPYITLAAR